MESKHVSFIRHYRRESNMLLEAFKLTVEWGHNVEGQRLWNDHRRGVFLSYFVFRTTHLTRFST